MKRMLLCPLYRWGYRSVGGLAKVTPPNTDEPASECRSICVYHLCTVLPLCIWDMNFCSLTAVFLVGFTITLVMCSSREFGSPQNNTKHIKKWNANPFSYHIFWDGSTSKNSSLLAAGFATSDLLKIGWKLRHFPMGNRNPRVKGAERLLKTWWFISKSCSVLSIPWTLAARLLCPWDLSGKDPGVDCHFLGQGILPTLGSHLGLLHCRQFFTDWATESPLKVWRGVHM